MFSKMIFRVGTVLPLLVGSTAMVGSGIILELVNPTAPAIAQTTFNTNLLIPLADQETYSVLVARAEANAEVKVQELFDKDLLRTEVRLTVLGQNGAAIAPVLKLRVSRQEWTSYPDPEIWSIYYPESQILLNLVPEPTPEPQPEAEEVVPIIEDTDPPAETFITPNGETLLNDESTTEPTDGNTIMETDEETNSPADNTTENDGTMMDAEGEMESSDSNSNTMTETEEEMKPSDSNGMTNNDEGMGSSRNNTNRRPIIYRTAE